MDENRTQVLRAEARERIASRDLRFYNMTRWSNMDALAESAKIRAEQPESMIPVLEAIYLQALANMTTVQEIADMLVGFRTCPPRRI